MNIARLNIERIPAELKIEIQRAQLRAEVNTAQMDIEYQNAQLSVDYVDPAVKVDMKGFYDGGGMQNYDSANRQNAAYAQQNVKEAISRMVDDARFIGDTASPMDAQSRWGSVARKNMQLPQPVPSTQQIRPNPVEITATPGELSMEWSEHDVIITWSGDMMPTFYLDPKASIEVYLEQRPMIKISLDESYIPKTVGRKIDEEV